MRNAKIIRRHSQSARYSWTCRFADSSLRLQNAITELTNFQRDAMVVRRKKVFRRTLQVYRQRCQRPRQMQFSSEIEKLFSNYTGMDNWCTVEQLKAI